MEFIFIKPILVFKHLFTKCITSITHCGFIPKIGEKDCFQIPWTCRSNTIIALLNVILTYVEGHFVDHFLFLLRVKTTEMISQNFGIGET